jgi:hypothetical protein
MKKMTTEEFIQRSKQAHGDRYDYSKTVYRGQKKRITFICKKHGEFEQFSEAHLRSENAPCCRRVYTEDFIKKARAIHGDKYDYSKTVYTSVRDKVTIICPKHGEYKSTPPNHYKGGCRQCAMEDKRLDQEGFLEQAIKVHGDKYDYSKAVYTRAADKLIIICPVHGEFEQCANNHLSGNGCRLCNVAYDVKTFIIKAREKHGDKYDYSAVKYKENTSIVKIKCPTHGYFKQKASTHMRGAGCPRCAVDATIERLKKGTEVFIEEARERHGDRYDYSKVEYITSTTDVIIVCKQHGEFKQMPFIHLKAKEGCPECALDLIRTPVTEFIERAKEKHGDIYDYSLIETIKNNEEKLPIICPVHGKFMVAMRDHLKSIMGCPECFMDTKRTSREDFIKRARKAHGNKYDYSKVEMSNNVRAKVIIGCPVHGEYEQTVDSHMKGHGCAKCYADDLRAKGRRVFMERSLEKNGDRFDFSDTDYISHAYKVNARCKTCGKTVTRDPRTFAMQRARCPYGCHFNNPFKFAADKLFDVFVKGKFPYDTIGKQETTALIIDTVDEYVGNDFNFLSLPGNGRELKYIADAFNLNIPDSLGVEWDSKHFKILQHLWRKIGWRLPMKKGDIDDLILEGLDQPFEVAHLDYNGFLTPKRIQSITKLVDETPNNGLVFVTLNTNTRGMGIEYPKGLLPIANGDIVMHQPYIGLRGSKMETFGIQKKSNVF